MENIIVTFVNQSMEFLDRVVIPENVCNRDTVLLDFLNSIQRCSVAIDRTIVNVYHVDDTETLLDSIQINKKFSELFSNDVKLEFIVKLDI